MRILSSSLRRQSGVSLVTSLIIVGALALMGIVGVMIANTQFKMAGNLQFQSAAMSDAESALAVAENWLPANFAHEGFARPGTPGLYPAGSAPDPLNTSSWDDRTSVRVDPAGNQRYMIELYLAGRTLPTNSVVQCSGYGTSAPCPKVNVYRILSRGVSRAGATRMVESYFAVRTSN
jgi:hypothetical protein